MATVHETAIIGSGVSFGEQSRREQTAVVEFRGGRVHGFEVPASDSLD